MKNYVKFDLEVRTLNFAKGVANFCKKLQPGIINNEYIRQLIRSSGSVGANYREANDSLGKKDFILKIKICLRESKESQYWLELISEINPTVKDEAAKWIAESIELRKIFSSIVNKSE